jgi:hypothetical protein
MIEFLTSPWILALAFFAVALAYSSVGLGGGSSYTALLAIFGFGAAGIPLLSLAMTLLVTTIGSFNFLRAGHVRVRLILPFLASSVPLAYLGGALEVPKRLFYWILLVSLLLVAVRIYLWKGTAARLALGRGARLALALAIGALLGLIAGIAGIGGGIYLVPLIIILNLGHEKEAAACGAIFVWANSLAGLTSRLQYNAIDLFPYIPLFVAVAVGGAAGSFLGAGRLSRRAMEQILGVIVLIAIGFLAHKIARLTLSGGG